MARPRYVRGTYAPGARDAYMCSVRLLACAVLAGAGCYPDNTAAERFYGTWLYAHDATQTSDCTETGVEMTVELEGTFEIVAGTQSDLLTGMSSACSIQLDVFDRLAMSYAGQTCDAGAPDHATIVIDLSTFMLGDTDAVLMFSTATSTVLPERTCRTKSTGSATKVP